MPRSCGSPVRMAGGGPSCASCCSSRRPPVRGGAKKNYATCKKFIAACAAWCYITHCPSPFSGPCARQKRRGLFFYPPGPCFFLWGSSLIVPPCHLARLPRRNLRLCDDRGVGVLCGDEQAERFLVGRPRFPAGDPPGQDHTDDPLADERRDQRRPGAAARHAIFAASTFAASSFCALT